MGKFFLAEIYRKNRFTERKKRNMNELLEARYKTVMDDLNKAFPDTTMLTQTEIASFLGVGIGYVRAHIGAGSRHSLSKYDVADFLCSKVK